MKTKVHFIRGFLAGAVAVALALAGSAAFAYDKPISSPNAYALSCGTSATRIGSTSKSDAWVIANPSNTPIYVGSSSVTTAAGFPVCTDTAVCTRSSFSADGYGGEFYCIVASGTVATRVIEGAL